MRRSLIRHALFDFPPYCPGLSIEEIQVRYGLSSVIKLASNENPLGVSPKVLQVLEKHLPEVHRYPRAGSPRLRQALGAYHGVPEDRIVAGNGSDEIIDLLIRMAVEPGRDHVLAFQPSFDIYRLQSQLCGVAFRQIALRCDFTFPMQELLAAVNDTTAMVFLTTPDNPSGYAPPVEAVLELHRRLPEDCLLVVDEAYMDFAVPQERYSVLSLAGNVPNLVVLRTFSKLYGLAGLRLGYGVMSAELADCLLRVKLPFSVNLLAEAAGIAALDDEAFRSETIRTVVQGRERLTVALGEMGFLVYTSQANFILVKPPLGAPELFEKLLSRGIIIRPLASYGLPDLLRISIGNAEENQALLRAIRVILEP
ncbi:MAG: histidinol-phosphate transaminase [Deltaproteobacteria bacterium]|nr:histidinol-phosphate transaminase [Deltaproteobacteria bacterium]